MRAAPTPAGKEASRARQAALVEPEQSSLVEAEQAIRPEEAARADVPVDRRTFMRRLPAVTTGVAAAVSAATLSACAATPYLTPVTVPEGLSVAVADLAPEDAAFVQAPGMERPIYLHRAASGGWVALLASCTHRGCQPEPLADRLVCPCHGSEFSLTGDVIEGPADEPLRRFDVVEAEGRLTVRLDGSRS